MAIEKLPSGTATVPVAVMSANVAVPVNVGEEVGAASAKADWMAVYSVVNSAPLITLSGSLVGSESLAPKLVAGVYVMLMIVS